MYQLLYSYINSNDDEINSNSNEIVFHENEIQMISPQLLSLLHFLRF